MPRNNSDKMELLQQVYANAAFRSVFLEFARTKYAEENVLFLCELVKLKEAPAADRAGLHARIVAEFLDSSSDKEVNLSSRAKKAMLAPPADHEGLFVCNLALVVVF